MTRTVLFFVAALYLATACYMFLTPHSFYDTVPGVAMMGPFNLHFIRDAGLAFLVSGAALGWAAARRRPQIALVGASWPFVHALFHIWIWLGRGMPFDQVALVNLLGIQLPAWAAFLASLSFMLAETKR